MIPFLIPPPLALLLESAAAEKHHHASKRTPTMTLNQKGLGANDPGGSVEHVTNQRARDFIQHRWGDALPDRQGFYHKNLASGTWLVLFVDREGTPHLLENTPAIFFRNHPRCATCSALIKEDGSNKCLEYDSEVKNPERFYCMNHDTVIVAANNSIIESQNPV